MECHGSPIELTHVAKDANGDDWLFVRHEDRCVSILRDGPPRPECVATFTAGAWAQVILGVFDGRLDDWNEGH